MNPSGFYGAVYDAAKSLGATDVQANLAAAQASNETGYGASVFGNNYFGIKASSTYTGPSAYTGTTEEINGVRTPTTGNFRTYENMPQSVADYMGMMAKNFPEAWNAPTLKEAVKNLDNGVYGKYATLSSYTSDIGKIANKYGPEAEANSFDASSAPIPEARPAATVNSFADLANAPTPSYPDLSKTGLLGALFSSEPATTQNAPASAPANVSATGLLGTPPDLSATAKVGSPLSNSGWQTMADAGPMGGQFADPMSRMGPQNPNDFQAMAFASPVQAPMDVTATAVQPTNPALAAQASVPAGLLSGLPSTPSMFAGPSLTGNLGAVSQQGLLNGTVNAVNASQQQALSTPMLSQAMSPSYPSLSQPVDVGQLSANSPFATPAVDPSVNAALSSFSAPTAATGTTDVGSGTGTPSTVSQRMGMPVSDWSTIAAATPISAPTLSSSTVSATPTTTGLLSGYQATPSTPPAQSAISGLLSGPATTAGNMSMLNQAMSPVSSLQTGIPQEPGVTGLNLGVQDPTYQNIVNASFPASIPSIEAASNLPSVTPSATMDSTVPGPATTAATTQQAISPPADVGVTTQAAPTHSMLNKGTLIGGLLGGAVAGPVGGIIGGLLGNKINQNGLSGILGSSPQVTPNNIGGGLMNVASVYGGAPPGTQAMTNNGGMVTSLGGGWTSYTNPYGVTESVSPWGGYAADWSGGFNGSRGPVGNGQPGGGGAPGGAGLY